ncbi:MAG: hypothetical protein GYA26_03330 [Flexilinea flocculi]|nr:hypothetical protein [Flexilinea flocculi]
MTLTWQDIASSIQGYNHDQYRPMQLVWQSVIARRAKARRSNLFSCDRRLLRYARNDKLRPCVARMASCHCEVA